jgi:hypothetical protein
MSDFERLISMIEDLHDKGAQLKKNASLVLAKDMILDAECIAAALQAHIFRVRQHVRAVLFSGVFHLSKACPSQAEEEARGKEVGREGVGSWV